MTLSPLVERFIQEEEGQSTVEFALLSSLIALVCMAAVRALRIKLVAVFNAAMVNMNTSSV